MKTEKELIQALRKDGMSGVMVNRMERMIGQFATLDGFFSASKADLIKAYVKTSGDDNQHGLGNKFWICYDRARVLYKDDGSPKAETAEETTRALDVDPNVMTLIPIKDLKMVLDFMEYCEVEAINILEITAFLRNVRKRQTKPAPAAPAGDGAGSDREA